MELATSYVVAVQLVKTGTSKISQYTLPKGSQSSNQDSHQLRCMTALQLKAYHKLFLDNLNDEDLYRQASYLARLHSSMSLPFDISLTSLAPITILFACA